MINSSYFFYRNKQISVFRASRNGPTSPPPKLYETKFFPLNFESQYSRCLRPCFAFVHFLLFIHSTYGFLHFFFIIIFYSSFRFHFYLLGRHDFQNSRRVRGDWIQLVSRHSLRMLITIIFPSD